MSSIKQATQNTFSDGMIMDLHPLSMPNTALVKCLNGTLLTYNGNEYMLLNDMGNGRVETAYLPEGYIPLGTAELGGIIYIISYNPQESLCLVGSFPSPERNITSNELSPKFILNLSNLITEEITKPTYEEESNLPTAKILAPLYKIIFNLLELNPGDKFLIFSWDLKKYLEYISWGKYIKYLRLDIIGLDEFGKIYFLNPLTEYKIELKDESELPPLPTLYPIRLTNEESLESGDLDEYRNVVNSNYSVNTLNKKITLGILVTLECIDNFYVNWDCNITTNTTKNTRNFKFTFPLNWTNKYKDDINFRNKVNIFGVIILEESDGPDNAKKYRIKYPTENIGEYNSYDPLHYDKLPTFYYLNKQNLLVERINNGSDEDFKDEYITYDILNVQKSTEEQIKNFTITPVMPFGILDYLKKTISIDLSKVGTGITNLIGWKYLVYDKKVKINYELESYLEKNTEIKGIEFNFYKLNENNKNIPKDIDDNWFIKETQWKKVLKNTNGDRINIKDANESGWLENISKSTPDYSSKQTLYGIGGFELNFDNIEKDTCYITEIRILYNTLERRYYRILYTAKLFNDYYLTTEDYSRLTLNDIIDNKIYANISSNSELYKLIGDNLNELKSDYLKVRDSAELCEISNNVKVHYTKNCDLKLNVADCGNLFNVKLDTTSEVEIKTDALNLKNNILSTDNPLEINDLNISFLSNQVDITENTENELYNIKVDSDLVISSPIKINYGNEEHAQILYLLSPLKISYKDGNGRVEKDKIWLEADAIGGRINGSNEKTVIKHFAEMLPKIDDDADILLTGWNVTYSDGIGNRGRIEYHIKGFLAGSLPIYKINGLYYMRRWHKGNVWETHFVLSTASIRGDLPIMFVTDLWDHKLEDSNGNQHDISESLKNYCNSDIFILLRLNCRKYVTSYESLYVWLVSNITYYDKENILYKAKVGVSPLCILINNCTIEKNTNLPHNLTYNLPNKIEFNIESTNSYLYSVNNIILDILTLGSNYYKIEENVYRGIPDIYSVYVKEGNPEINNGWTVLNSLKLPNYSIRTITYDNENLPQVETAVSFYNEITLRVNQKNLLYISNVKCRSENNPQNINLDDYMMGAGFQIGDTKTDLHIKGLLQ